MTAKPSAAEIKTLYRDIRALLPENVAPSQLLSALANHAAVLKMLEREHPPAAEEDLRRVLARLAALAGLLEKWVEPPSPTARKESLASRNSETEADTAPAPAETFSDPAALAGHAKVKVFVDGASKGNPGPASVGLVFTDLEGNTIFEEGRYLGEMTNNAAEYMALIHALEVLVEQGCPEGYFFSDSELMVKQISGHWRIKHAGLMPLAQRAQALRRKLSRFQITHVPRENNRRADQLANIAFRQARDAGRI